MADGPNRVLLDRSKAAADAQKLLGPTLSLVEEVVDYGTHLIVRLMSTSDPGIFREMVVGALLKHVVLMLDAIHILCDQGATRVAMLQARSLLEASLYCEWMLKENQEERARAYYVWNLRQERHWARRGILGTPEQESIQAHLESTLGPGAPSPAADAETNAKSLERIHSIDEYLSKEPLRQVNERFEAARAKAKEQRRDWEVERWYQVLGKRSLREIAKELDQMGTYVVFYDLWSRLTHANSYREHFTILESERLAILPIRSLREANTLLQVALALTFGTYRCVLNFLRPGEIEAYSRRYQSEWRQRYLTIPRVDEQVEIVDSID